MSSYLSSFTGGSSISTALSSRLNSLRRAITLGDEGDDPENEDCSHISNALRAYYTEKGRPFPPWLPPDPKAPAAATPRVIATAQPGSQGSVNYGRGGGLGDLWGDSGASSPSSAQTASLRRGRGGAASVPPPSPGPQSSTLPYASPLTHAQSQPLRPSGGRPLPSQRAGSSQSIGSGGSGGSAQERLRARLQGGRSPSPANMDPSIRKPVGSSGRQY
ncbi:hypothetical protein N7468_000320 [Penicillium chermesinum]|uniref:Mso1 N-terminal domain-containing protein n=1 Tax=Penicillium chermesinum TaxID=63820 RepID=A0A9W9TYQ7_9EURO|nr:uncharacterized protein N7468_000320 [Penicillium chermesinum]KAJ5248869.1 hypothetical protein N7468_000320 [Penicillium chermesinum]KAJ6150970.1 hypothetical protein N7470_007564 [Penicillium chermesinum]